MNVLKPPLPKEIASWWVCKQGWNTYVQWVNSKNSFIKFHTEKAHEKPLMESPIGSKTSFLVKKGNFAKGF